MEIFVLLIDLFRI